MPQTEVFKGLQFSPASRTEGRSLMNPKSLNKSGAPYEELP
jgi:hypothetical protein